MTASPIAEAQGALRDRPATAVRPVGGMAIGGVLREVAPFLVVALCTLVLLRDDLFLGAIFYERDTDLFYLPLLRWYLEQMHQGHVPLWMPLIFGGYPLFP